MGDEYIERKIRVYEAEHHKGESKLQKYLVKPITKMAGSKPKEQSYKESRLTA